MKARYILLSFLALVGGHPAVSNRYTRDGRTIRNIYIDLSDVQRDSGAVWSFEGSPTPEGRDCEQQFVAMIHSVKVTERRRPAG